MSIKSAKQFILNSNNSNDQFKNIIKNTSSKFESTNAKLEYIAEKAKTMGFDFSAKELETAFKEINNLTNQDLSKKTNNNSNENSSTGGLVDSTKNFWNSLW